MTNMNLRVIFTKIFSECALKKIFNKVIGIYFDSEKLFCVHLSLEAAEDDSVECWRVIDTAEVMLFYVNRQLSDRSRQILMEFGALDEDLEDIAAESDHIENIRKLVANKIKAVCRDKNWQTKAVALCLNVGDVVVEFEDLSNIPKDKIANTVQYQISAAGNMEIESFYFSFMELVNGIWMEGLSKIEVSEWIDVFKNNDMELIGLTAMPDEVNSINGIDLIGVDRNFIEQGGLKAIFAANSVAYQTNPNLLIDKTKDLNGWNFNRIAAAITLITSLILTGMIAFDFWSYKEAQASLENEKEQIALLEADRRKIEFIERNVAELKNKQQILMTLSKVSFPWRSLLIHFGTIKVKGVWLKEIRASNNETIEVKCEAVNYEAMANFVKELENDTEFFSNNLKVKNSEVREGNHSVQSNESTHPPLVQFTVEIEL